MERSTRSSQHLHSPVDQQHLQVYLLMATQQLQVIQMSVMIYKSATILLLMASLFLLVIQLLAVTLLLAEPLKLMEQLILEATHQSVATLVLPAATLPVMAILQ